jgi:hypothetical protein
MAILASENIHEDIVSMIDSQLKSFVATKFSEETDALEFAENFNNFL